MKHDGFEIELWLARESYLEMSDGEVMGFLHGMNETLDSMVVCYDLPISFIKRFENSLNWHLLVRHQVITKEIQRMYRNHLDYSYIDRGDTKPKKDTRRFQALIGRELHRL